MQRKSTKYIAIHCSGTRPSQDVSVTEIRKWHKAQGWTDIGYHYVIKRDGTVQRGRAEGVTGAHVKGYNAVSIGVCMVGGVKQDDFTVPEDNFTAAQWAALKELVAGLKEKYPGVIIQGHRDFPKVAKACPSFDVKQWLKRAKFA